MADTTLPHDQLLPVPGGGTPATPPGFTPRRELGRGGMGVVLEAWSERLGRPVALKLLRPDAALSPELVLRFQREARLLARLEHPHVVRVLDSGQDASGRPWLALELVTGESLAARVERGRLSAVEAARVTRDLAGALARVHAQGVLHRDVKPANVLLGQDGRARLTDFGLARLLDDDGRLTATGEVLGTPAYMAPEQVAAGRVEVDAQADVYGLGALLYELLTGARPFPGVDPLVILRAVLEAPPVRPGRLVPGLSSSLEAIVLRCLEKDPRRRPPGAAALRDLLDGWLQRPGEDARRGRSWAALAAAGMGLVALGGTLAALPALHPPPALPPPPAPAPTPSAPPAVAEPPRLGPGLPDEALCRAAAEVEAGQLDPDALDPSQRAALDFGRTLRDVYSRGRSMEELRLPPANAPEPWGELSRTCAVAFSGNPEALPRLEGLEEHFPRLAFLRLIRGLLLDGLDQREEADRALEAAVALAPEIAYLHLARANRLGRHRDPAGALEELEAAKRLGPEAPLLCLLETRRAEALLRLHRLEEADAAARRALELEPDHPLPWILRGQAALLRDELDAAGEALARARALGASGTDAHFLAGSLHLARGDPLDALGPLSVALRQDPGYEDPLIALADAYGQLGAWRQQLDLIEDARASGMQDPELLAERVQCLFGLGRYLEASQEAERAAATHPRPEKRERLRAMSQLARQAAGQLSRDDWRACRARLGGLTGAWELLLPALDQELSAAPGDPGLHLVRGLVRRRLGAPGQDEDLERFRQGRMFGPELGELAELLAQVGLVEETRALLESHLQGIPADPDALLALARLAQLRGDGAGLEQAVSELLAAVPRGHACACAGLYLRAVSRAQRGERAGAREDARTLAELAELGAPVPVAPGNLEGLARRLEGR